MTLKEEEGDVKNTYITRARGTTSVRRSDDVFIGVGRVLHTILTRLLLGVKPFGKRHFFSARVTPNREPAHLRHHFRHREEIHH